ncbi:hypothetical protein RQP46_003448 [Phenoliferia psychrophenolica]
MHDDPFATLGFDFAFASDMSALIKAPEFQNELPLDLASLTAQSYAAFDATLDSPLGLDGADTPLSQFLTSPMFSDDGSVSLPGLDFSFPLFPSLPLVPPTTTTSASTSSASPKPPPTTNSRASAPPLDLTAPIEPRTYLLPSTTSRKRKTTLIERELAKRQATGDDVPEDLVAAVEKKRTQNTLSARKSRMRKQQKVGDLESENERLKVENGDLKAKVASLEAMLNTLIRSPQA